jgi:hypothetical protein
MPKLVLLRRGDHPLSQDLQVPRAWGIGNDQDIVKPRIDRMDKVVSCEPAAHPTLKKPVVDISHKKPPVLTYGPQLYGGTFFITTFAIPTEISRLPGDFEERVARQ